MSFGSSFNFGSPSVFNFGTATLATSNIIEDKHAAFTFTQPINTDLLNGVAEANDKKTFNVHIGNVEETSEKPIESEINETIMKQIESDIEEMFKYVNIIYSKQLINAFYSVFYLLKIFFVNL